MKTVSRAKTVRIIILMGILSLSTVLGLLHQFGVIFKPFGVDAFCPFGGLESVSSLFTSGTLLRRVTWSSVILLVAVLLTALVLRRSFCGHICPLGMIQELFGSLGRKVFRRRMTVPRVADVPARFLKYGVLVFFLFFTWRLGYLVIRPFDPWAAYHHIISRELFSEFLIGAAVLIGSAVGSLLYERFFCKYLCPMGAFLGVFGRLGWFRVKRNPDTCINCKICTKVCPVNIDVAVEDEVKTSECISCSLCTYACPVEETLEYTGPKKKGVISFSGVMWVTAGIFAAVVGLTTITGQFQWAQYTVVTEARKTGKVNVGLIKGSTTFRELVVATGIPEETFIQVFGITEEDINRKINEVGRERGFGTGSVRNFIVYALQEAES